MRSIEIVVDAKPSSAGVVIIGGGQVGEKLESVLKNKSLSPAIFPGQNQIDPSLSPDFIFWFPNLGETAAEYLLNYVEAIGSKLIIVLPERLEDKQLKQFIDKNLDVCAVILVDLFGPKMTGFPITRLFLGLKDFRIQSFENDHVVVAPLFVDDAVEALCKIAFSSQTFGKTLILSGANPMSLIVLAQKIARETRSRSGKAVKIVNSGETYPQLMSHHEKRQLADKSFSLLSWRPSVSVPEAIKRAIIDQLGQANYVVDRSVPAPIIKKKIDSTPSATVKILVAGSAAILIIAVILPILGVFWAKAAQDFLTNKALGLKNSPSPKLIALAESAASIGSLSLKFASPTFYALNLRDRRQDLETSFNLARRRLEESFLIGKIIRGLKEVADSAAGNSGPAAATTMDDLSSTASTFLKMSGSELLKNSQSPEDENRQLVGFGRELIPAARWLLGMEGKKTFLLALENSNELRPTGGYLDSIGVVSAQNGKILDLSFINTATIDSLLQGTEAPPDPIKSALGATTWLMRDANWSPDGPSAAARIAKMFFRATGRSADGVIFLSSQGLKTILSQTGKIGFDENDSLSAENLDERLAYFGDVDLATGKRQNFLAETVKGLEKILGTDSSIKLIKGLILSLRAGDIFMVAFDQNIARTLSDTGVDGAIKSPSCPAQFHFKDCSNDFLLINDANLGVNQADYFLRRERDILTQLSVNKPPITTVTLRYLNTSKSASRPAGVYRGYTRIMIPIDSVVRSIVKIVPQGLVELSADNSIESGKHTIGIPIEIQPGTEEVIKLSFESGRKLPLFEGMGGYSLFFQRQPGSKNSSTLVTVELKDNLTPIAVYPLAKIVDNKLLFFLPENSSETIAVELASL